MSKQSTITLPSLKHSLRFLLVSFFFFFSFTVFAQDWTYTVKGTVKKDGEKMEGAIITLFKNGSQVSQQVTKKNGNFGVVLEPNNDYILSVGAPGHITKKLEFNTQNVPVDRGKYGFGTFIIEEISIFEVPPNLKGVDIDECLGKPLALVSYIKQKEDFGYDLTYSNKMSDCLKILKKKQDQAKKDAEAKADSLKNISLHQAQIDNDYNNIIQQADQFFKVSDFKDAKDNYLKAQTIKPKEAYPPQQIALCDVGLNKLNDQAAIDKKYKDLLKLADDQFGQSSWQAARDLYVQASAIKPTEVYPKNQITICDDKLGADKGYLEAIAKADGFFKTSKWTDARASYVVAQGLKPKEAYPPAQILICDKNIKDEGNKSELEKQYKDALAKADAFFAAKNYFDAKTNYQVAQKLKPSEVYPPAQIALCDERITGSEKDKLYLAAIIKADALFKSSDWLNAKNAYNEALLIKPSEPYPPKQIALCDAKLNELKNNADLDQKYKDAITKADGLFKASDWANAKSAYQDALGIKPLEKYPPAQILLCDKYINDLKNTALRDQQYKDAIAKADALFKASNWADAKAAYKGASTIKPDEKYPPAQIILCDAELDKLAKSKLLDQQYKDAIAKADGFFKLKNFSDAKTNYMNAGTLKPTEPYPPAQILLCDAELKKQGDSKLKDQQYKDALAKADAFFKALDYVDAKDAYQGASNIKPDEKYPPAQILICDAKIKEADLNKKYQEIITKADGLFKTSDWANAKSTYQEALGLKPLEKYPPAQILLCDKNLNDLKNTALTDQKYKDLITKADGLFKGSDWANAKSTYKEASTLKPTEKYPPQQIALCDAELKKIDDAKALDKQYNDAIVKADAFFKAKNFSDAKTNYMTAGGLKPKEVYPPAQIALCDIELKKIGDGKEKDQKYKDALAKADGYFKALDYKDAKDAYQGASNIKPEEKYPPAQILICDEKIKAAELDQKYKDAIAKADGLFKASNWTDAKSAYNDALLIKPLEKYPPAQILICDKNIAAGDLNAKYTDAIKRGDNNFKSSEYNTALLAYQEALTFKAKDAYATSQIALCNSKLAIEAKYKEALAKADKLFGNKEWANAKVAYQDALKIKDDQYPKDQIAQCDKNIFADANNADLLAKYNAAILKADKQRDVANAQVNPQPYKDAKTLYQEALTYKAGDPYATGEIAKIDEKLKNLTDPKYMNDMYQAAIKKADKLFSTKDYLAARDAYKEAQSYFPSNPYPQLMIDKCNKILADQDLALQNSQNYEKAMTAGDNFMTATKYEDAINSYNLALTYKPGDEAALNKIAECQLKLKQLENSHLNDQEWIKYNELMKKADVFFDGRDFAKARIFYNNARVLKPAEQRPKDRIAECDKLMNGQTVAKDPTLVAKPDDPTERKKRYEYLKKTYGMGMHEIPEVTDGNKKRLQRVVVTDSPDTTDVYTRMTYGYGGTFYYKNDVPITMEEFNQMTGPQ